MRYVGDGLCPTCAYQIDRLQRLAGRDPGEPRRGVDAGGTASIDAGLRAITSRLRDSVVSLTTINEPDISGNPNWIADTRTSSAELYTPRQGRPGRWRGCR